VSGNGEAPSRLACVRVHPGREIEAHDRPDRLRHRRDQSSDLVVRLSGSAIAQDRIPDRIGGGKLGAQLRFGHVVQA